MRMGANDRGDAAVLHGLRRGVLSWAGGGGVLFAPMDEGKQRRRRLHAADILKIVVLDRRIIVVIELADEVEPEQAERTDIGDLLVAERDDAGLLQDRPAFLITERTEIETVVVGKDRNLDVERL